MYQTTHVSRLLCLFFVFRVFIVYSFCLKCSCILKDDITEHVLHIEARKRT